ncbi:MAG: hypothetical protein JJU03_09075 [Idiomarina sp.]|nr:hypothetical protein [Idiomarina sp.]
MTFHHPRVWFTLLCVFTLTACSEGHPDDLPGAVNNPYPDVSISESSTVNIDPADSAMTYAVPVNLSRAAPEGGQIRFRTTSGTALPDRDYEEHSGSVSFNEGQRQVNIPVQLLNDSGRSLARDFRIELTGANNAFLTGNVSHTVTISAREQTNDDQALATLNLPNQIDWTAPTEGVFEYSVVIPLSARTAQDASVEIRVIPGTARLGEHIEKVTGIHCEQQVCAIEAGKTELSFSLPVYGHPSQDPRTFQLQFLSPEGLELPQQREVDVVISYSDEVEAALNVPQLLTLRMPSAERAPLAYPIVFTLSHQLQAPATLEWRTVDGSAFAGQHYVAVESTGDDANVLRAGATEFAFELELLHDADLDDNVTFQLQLVSAEGLMLPEERIIDIEIVNSNGAGLVTPSVSLPSEVIYHEPLETKDYSIYLPLSEAMPQDGSLRVSLIEQTARHQLDFVAYTEVIEVSEYSTEVNVPVRLLYNPEQTDDREFRVELSSPSNLALPSERSFNVRVVDAGNAAPEPLLQLTPDLIRVPAPAVSMGPQEVTLYFELSDELTETAGITVRSRNGSAASGVDFNEVAMVDYQLLEGSKALEITLQILATTSDEQREFELVFSQAQGIRLPESRSVTVQIDPRNTSMIPVLEVPTVGVELVAPEDRGDCALNGDREELFCRRHIALPFSDFAPLQGRLRVITQDRTARNEIEFELLNEELTFGIGSREVLIPIWVSSVSAAVDFELIVQSGTNLQLPDTSEQRVISVVIQPY